MAGLPHRTGPRPSQGQALYPMSVRRPPDLPPASSPPRIAATQLPPACAGAGFWLSVPLLAARRGLSPPSSVPCVAHHDRGRESRLGSAPPPSEPDVRISRIRLSSRWFYLQED